MAHQSSTRSPSSRLPTTQPETPSPPIGQLKTPQDAAVSGVGARLGELGSKLSALSGFGRGQEVEASGDGGVGGMEGEGVKKDQAGEEGEKGEPDYDPFTGAPLRRLIPLQASLPSFTGSTSAPGPGGTATPAEPSLSHQLWSHLATVRRLQAELAAQHIAMEDVTGRSGSGRGGALGGAGPRDLSSEQAARNMGEEGEATREERGRERQEAVKGIMSKLDELSRAVTAYHGVVTPSLDLAPSPGRTRSTTLSHGTPAHDGAFSDSALSELGPRGGGGDALGLGRVGSGWELGRRGSGRGMLGEDVVESPIGGSHGFEI